MSPAERVDARTRPTESAWDAKEGDARAPWLSGSLVWVMVVVLGATVTSFGASVAYSHHANRMLDQKVQTIATNAVPAIEHLARARAQLLHLQLALVAALERSRSGAPLDRAPFDDILAKLHRQLDAYRAIPLLPHESPHVATSERAIERLEVELGTVLGHLDARDAPRAVGRLRTELSAALARADRSLAELVNFNAEHQRHLGMAISVDQLRATEIGYGLYGLSLLFALLLVTLVLRNAKHYTFLVDQQGRLAERRAHDLADFSARLEALVDSSLTISNTITISTDLKTMFREISDEARSVIYAASCTLYVHDVDGVDGSSVVSSAASEEDRPGGPTLTVPLLREGAPFGALQLTREKDSPPFSRDDAQVAELFAAHVGVAIENARLYERARAATRAREDLLAAVSHDLRNPLNSIQLAAGVLREDLGDAQPATSLITRIERSVERMTLLIRDLLGAAQVESDRFSADLQPTDLRALVEDVVEIFSMAAADASVRLSMEVPSINVLCERHLLFRVLANLLSNALKFTPAGGSVRITAEARDREVVLSIADSGRGIAEEHLAHLFDRYWQPEHADRRGSGLGLYIARGIVEAHGGRIDVESTLGAGATFHITLRAAPAPQVD